MTNETMHKNVTLVLSHQETTYLFDVVFFVNPLDQLFSKFTFAFYSKLVTCFFFALIIPLVVVLLIL